MRKTDEGRGRRRGKEKGKEGREEGRKEGRKEGRETDEGRVSPRYNPVVISIDLLSSHFFFT